MLQFLKPSLWKVALTLILFLAASFLWRAFVTARISDTFPLGFPFEYYVGWGPCPPGEQCSEFSPLFLVMDLVSWHVVSAFIVRRSGKKRP